MGWDIGLLGIYTCIALDNFGTYVTLPSIPMLNERLSMTFVDIGISSSFSSFLVLFSGIVVGIVSDRFGQIATFRCTTILQLLASVSLQFAFERRSFHLFATSRTIFSLFKCAMTLSQTYVARRFYSSTDLPRLLGFCTSAANVGFLLGPLIGGYASSFNDILSFQLASGIRLLTILLLFLIPETTFSKSRSKQEKEKQSRPYLSTPTSQAIKPRMFTPQTICLLVVRFLVQLSNSVYEVFFINRLKTSFGYSGSASGNVLSYIGVVSIIANSGIFNEITSSDSIVFYSSLSFAVGLTAFELATDIRTMLVAVTLVAAAVSVLLNAVQSEFVILSTATAAIIPSTTAAEVTLQEDDQGDAQEEKEDDEKKGRDNVGAGGGEGVGARVVLCNTIDRATRALAPVYGGLVLSSLQQRRISALLGWALTVGPAVVSAALVAATRNRWRKLPARDSVGKSKNE